MVTDQTWSYYEIDAPVELKGIVKNFWVFEYNREEINRDYLLPSSLGYLFYMKTDKTFHTHASDSGQISKIENGFYAGYLNSRVEFTHNQILVTGASIFPVYLSLIFGKGPQHFKDQFIRQDDIDFNAEGASVEHIIECMKRFMLEKLDQNPLKEEVTRFYTYLVKHRKYKITVDQMAAWSGYTTRNLINVFNKYLGISPKKFIQLIRFNHGLELMMKSDKANLTHVAQELGYHDQSHFIRDCKKMCGKTPSELVKDTSSLSRNFTLY